MRKSQVVWMLALVLAAVGVATGCSSTKTKNKAMETAARYWQDKAYPGKSYDVQVISAEKADNGQYQVKGIVDGETRVGLFNPDSETFSEGYYSLAAEKEKHIAELEEQVKYWKEKADELDKENYKLKVKLNLPTGDNDTSGGDVKKVSDDQK